MGDPPAPAALSDQLHGGSPSGRPRSGRLLVAAHPDADRHDPGDGHPERPARLRAAVSGFDDLGITDGIDWLAPRAASREELAAVHDIGYLDAVAGLCAHGGGVLDPDTTVSPGSWQTAQATAGAGLAAIDALSAGRGDAAWIIGRPPGHHATRGAGMGFCLLNNVAVSAAALTRRGEKVVIFDWDVHHGNGTQGIFWEDPSVFYVSIHQWPLYPGTGRPEERGGGPGWGTTVNLPLPPRSTGDTYLALFDDVIAPCVEQFGPTWVLVSAGFDAHRDDPLADMRLTAGDFADLTGRVADLVAGPGRLALFLEGGYHLPALRSSVAACTARLIGHPSRPEPASSGGAGMDRVAGYRATFAA